MSPLPDDLAIGPGGSNPYSAAEQLEALEDAEEAFEGESDFAASCRVQWEERGYLTARQVKALRRVATQPDQDGDWDPFPGQD